MLILPEIQSAEGRVVTRASSTGTQIVHDIGPLEAARRFAAEGAERLHVVDVDASAGHAENNADIVRAIVDALDIPVQVAGGMRTVAQIEDWLEHGVAAVVLGTLAITDPVLVADVSARHPGAVLASLATKDGWVMIDNWRTQTAFRPQDMVYDLQMAGVAGIIHTDINRFEGDASETLALTMELNENVVIPVYSSGTVHSLDDIARLRYLPNIHGVIVGHALLNGAISMADALDVARQSETSPDPEVETAMTARGIQHGVSIYLAAYNESLAARWWNQDLRAAITDDNPYVEVVIPQEDLEIDLAGLTPRQIQARYEQAIETADAVLVVLDGIENEAWTGFECGFARASGKYLLGLTHRAAGAGRTRFEAMCDDVVSLDGADDKLTLLAAISKEVKSRLLFEQEAA
jgi:phosphoribosylformimino-5-aminoimidazole carboxamide ribotide isomerase